MPFGHSELCRPKSAKVTTKLTKISPNGHTAYELLAFDSRPHRTAFRSSRDIDTKRITSTYEEMFRAITLSGGYVLAMFGYVLI